MTRIRLSLLAVFSLVLLLIPARAPAQCVVGYANGFIGPSYLNNEGQAERPSDVAISTGAANCFSSGNNISVTYNGILTNPTALSNTSSNNLVISNPNAGADGALVLQVTTTSGISAAGPQTVIEMLVLGATTDPAATITLQNLRFDVTGLAGTVAAAANMNVFVSGSSAGLTAVSTHVIGLVVPTVNLAKSTLATGLGVQSSGGPLGTQATINFASPAIWGTSPFRVAITAPKYPVGCGAPPPLVPCTDTVDIATGDTSLILAVTKIPTGVTVTFPATMSIYPAVGAANPTWQWKARASYTTTGGTVVAIYDTVLAPAAALANLKIVTAGTAADATSGTVAPAVPPTPISIGVSVGTASGSGTADILVAFGPTKTGAFTGDDVNATAIPVYTPGISTTGVGREIITDIVVNPLTGVDTAPTAFFTITPTQTALLFTYATDADNYLTGLVVVNTANDSGVFTTPTKGQTGPITWYFFPNGSAPFSTSTPNVAPGSTYATSLDPLLTAAGQGALVGKFSGYVIAVAQFQYAHGFSIVFSPLSGGAYAPTSSNALVLGGGNRDCYISVAGGACGLLQ